MSTTQQDEIFMKKAIELAEAAELKGNHPFGALIVVDNEIVLTAENTVVTEKNFTHHAELNLMNLVANSSLTASELSKATVYTSTEPCAMCSGAIVWSGIKNVVYGCSCETLGEIAGDDFLMPCRNLFCISADAPIAVKGPVLQEEARILHDRFWVKK